MNACPNFIASKSLCVVLLEKFGKEDLAKVVAINLNGGQCRVAYDNGFSNCPHYIEQQNKLKK